MIEDKLEIKMYAFTIDCPDPGALAAFYAELLGWQLVYQDEEYACVGVPGRGQGAYPGLTFQKNADFQPPVWPEEPGSQQQMAHLDFAVNDLEEAVGHAVRCGARVAKVQFSDGWRVMLDPAGHPFCLCQMGELFKSPHFGLL